MFNLARKRLEDESSDDKMLKVVHENKLKSRDASIQDDASNIARLCAQTDQDPESIMDDDYWSWVRAHDGHYYREVAKKARGIAAQMREEADNPSPDAKYVPPAPIPKQKPGGAGGAMASSRPVMFLKRNVGGYRLMGTIVGDLLSGELPFLKEDGTAFLMDVTDGTSVNRFGPSAIESLRIQEDMPGAMREAARKFLSSIGRKDAESLSRSIVARYLRKKKLDMLPLSVALKGERAGFLLRLGIDAEPSECQTLREEMGKAIAPMISRLRAALLVDGIETSELPAPMPPFTEQGRKALEEKESAPFDDPSSSPEALSPDDVEDCVDVPSLVMTVSSPETRDETRNAAAERLVEIICRLPQVYEKYELSDAELSAISAASGNSPASARLASFAKLFRADDAAIMEAYSMNEGDRGLIASLVGTQGRRDIIDAVPEMAIQGGSVIPEFMSAIGHSGPGLRFLESFVTPGDGCPEKIISRKIIEAISDDPDGEIVQKALSSFPMARNFALLTLLEKGVEHAVSAMERIPGSRDDCSWDGVLLCSAISRTGDEKAMKLAYFITGARPIDVMEFAGRRGAAAFMKANRITPEGEPIPEASDILSAPEDPLPLAKSLAAMGDYQAMLILMRACARRARRGHAKHMWYAMSFMNDALRAVGKGDLSDSIMSSSGVSIDDEAGVIRRVPRRSSVAMVDGRIVTGSNGVYVHGGRAYACDQETAASLPVIFPEEDLGPGREKM